MTQQVTINVDVDVSAVTLNLVDGSADITYTQTDAATGWTRNIVLHVAFASMPTNVQNGVNNLLNAACSAVGTTLVEQRARIAARTTTTAPGA